MDFSLTDEQRLIAATVRDFVERELYPHEDEVERLDEVPGQLARTIRNKAIAAGLYAPNMPADLGGDIYVRLADRGDPSSIEASIVRFLEGIFIAGAQDALR